MDELEGFLGYKIDVTGYLIRLAFVDSSGKQRRAKEILFSVDSDGYEVCHLWKDGKRIQCKKHRLLAIMYKNNPNNYPQINHIDGNKKNNNLNNLEWCTAKHNTIHAVKTGLRIAVSGDAHYKRRLKCELQQVI